MHTSTEPICPITGRLQAACTESSLRDNQSFWRLVLLCTFCSSRCQKSSHTASPLWRSNSSRPSWASCPGTTLWSERCTVTMVRSCLVHPHDVTQYYVAPWNEHWMSCVPRPCQQICMWRWRSSKRRRRSGRSLSPSCGSVGRTTLRRKESTTRGWASRPPTAPSACSSTLTIRWRLRVYLY